MLTKLLAALDRPGQCHSASRHFFLHYVQSAFRDDLLCLDCYGEHINPPMSVEVKVEQLLEACETRRELHRQKLAEKLRRYQEEDMRMDPTTDVTEILNTWRWDVETWMKSSTLEKYRQYQKNGKRNDAQQLGKKSFSTYTFHLSGRKHLLHKLLELPVIAMSQDSYPWSDQRSPVIFIEFLESLLNELQGTC